MIEFQRENVAHGSANVRIGAVDFASGGTTMGLGPNVLALYQQMKQLGGFDGITDVIELGSQGVWCPDRELLSNLFAAFDKPMPPEDEIAPYLNDTGTGIAPSRHLHEALGFRYECIDIDAKFGSLTLDLNFDAVPAAYRNRFDLTTNHGTTEHLLNQYNAFKAIHDLTRPGGLMLHVLGFTVHLEHGFFNYQPNFFEALARFNAYRTLGLWLAVDCSLHSFIPWEPRLLDYLSFNAKSTHVLLVLQKKLYDKDFCVPIQKVYETSITPESAARYQLVVDGDYYSATRLAHLTKNDFAPSPPQPSEPAPAAISAPAANERPPLDQYGGRELLKEAMARLKRRMAGNR